MSRYIRAWLSDDGFTVCWQYAGQSDCRRNAVRRWAIDGYVVYQWYIDSEITRNEAMVIVASEQSGNITRHHVDLNFWKGDRPKARRKKR